MVVVVPRFSVPCSWRQFGEVIYSMARVNHTSSLFTQNFRWSVFCMLAWYFSDYDILY